jgi:hypothetical protein
MSKNGTEGMVVALSPVEHMRELALEKSPQQVRRVAKALGTALFLAGLTSAVIATVPLALGNVDWELGVVGELAATAALPVMGLGLLLALALEARSPTAVLAFGTLAWIGAFVALLGLAIITTNVPLVWTAFAGQPPRQAQSVKIAVLKTVALSGLYALALSGFGWYAVRSFMALRRK